MADRKELCDILRRLSPALAPASNIPAMPCFCFSGTDVHAWDDTLAIVAPYKAPFSGGIHGRLLLDWLGASGAKAVEFIGGGSQIAIKAGRATKLDTPLLPAADFLFTAPDARKAVAAPISVELLAALSRNAATMTDDSKMPFYGVTISVSAGGAEIYSATQEIITRCRAGKLGAEFETRIIPPRFLSQFLAYAKDAAPQTLSLGKDVVSAKFKGGLQIYCRTIAKSDLERYRGFFGMYEGGAKALIPKNLGKALARAAAALPYVTGDEIPHTAIKVEKGKARLDTPSPAGRIRDSVDTDHPDVEVACNPVTVGRGLEHAADISFFPDTPKLGGAIRLSGPGYACLISTIKIRAKKAAQE